MSDNNTIRKTIRLTPDQAKNWNPDLIRVFLETNLIDTFKKLLDDQLDNILDNMDQVVFDIKKEVKIQVNKLNNRIEEVEGSFPLTKPLEDDIKGLQYDNECTNDKISDLETVVQILREDVDFRTTQSEQEHEDSLNDRNEIRNDVEILKQLKQHQAKITNFTNPISI